MGGPNSVGNDLMRGMGFIPQQVDMTPPPPPPDPMSTAAADLQAQEKQQGQMQGRASTILTGGAGLLDQPTTASRTLLGN